MGNIRFRSPRIGDMASPWQRGDRRHGPDRQQYRKRDRTFSCFDFHCPVVYRPTPQLLYQTTTGRHAAGPLSCLAYRSSTYSPPSRSAPACRWRGHTLRQARCRRPVSFSYRNEARRLRAVHGGSPVKSLPRLRDIRTGIQLHLRFILRNINILNLAVVVAAASAAHEEGFGFSVGQRPAEFLLVARGGSSDDLKPGKSGRRSDAPAVGAGVVHALCAGHRRPTTSRHRTCSRASRCSTRRRP